MLAIVTRERDLAVKEKRQLQAKLENLEQVLKVGGDPLPPLGSARGTRLRSGRRMKPCLKPPSKFRALGAVFTLPVASRAINNKIQMFLEAVP